MQGVSQSWVLSLELEWVINWGMGQFRNPEAGEYVPLKTWKLLLSNGSEDGILDTSVRM
jgi:hypothetical protein